MRRRRKSATDCEESVYGFYVPLVAKDVDEDVGFNTMYMRSASMNMEILIGSGGTLLNNVVL